MKNHHQTKLLPKSIILYLLFIIIKNVNADHEPKLNFHQSNASSSTIYYKSSSSTESYDNSTKLEPLSIIPKTEDDVYKTTEIEGYQDDFTTEPVSFGIRSFTVAISTNAKNLESLKLSTTTPGDSTTANSAKTNPSETEPKLEHETENNSNPTKSEDKTTDSTNFGTPFQIDKKLENGLYRIKIAEIITDEFNNAFDELQDTDKEGDEEENANNLGDHNIIYHKINEKINIDDFYPSKIEDFKSIIEISNNKILKEKNNLHENEIRNNLNSVATSNSTGTNLANSSTTNIEIELIEDTFIDDMNENSHKTTDEITTTHSVKINTEKQFIPKRVKKFDPQMKTLKFSDPIQKHGFGITKFSSESPDKRSDMMQNSKNQSQIVPGFSTTKFYNNNEAPGKKKSINRSPILVPKTDLKNNLEPTKQNTPSDIRPTTMKSIAQATSAAPLKYRISEISLSKLEQKLNSLDCEVFNLSTDTIVWRGNETHELYFPINTPNGSPDTASTYSWEGSADIQSGDLLIVKIDDTKLKTNSSQDSTDKNIHRNSGSVYQVTRHGYEFCDITEGELLDITPLDIDGKKLITLYDKDLTDGINLLIVVSDVWDKNCVRLRINLKSDNCGENAECSGKGVCYSNGSMEGYECQCCTGFTGPHCEEIDACTPSPCTNNGICLDLSQGHDGNSYQCLCPYGYAGKICQFESDPCNPSQCLNGGSCTGNSTHFRCDCAPGYSGELCQYNLNECESSPCVHGICVDQQDGFRCFCQPGFSGDLCNYEYNECESNPCINGGQCIDHIGSYSCQCTNGYEGARCEIKVDFCANNPCEDGYRCIDHGDNYSCVCPGGKIVPDCHEAPRVLCALNPCANGGTCWTSDKTFYCACQPGYTGKMCEDEFVIDTIVSSNELLSDISNQNNVISFGDSHTTTQHLDTVDLSKIYHVAQFTGGLFAVFIFVIIIFYCKNHKIYGMLHKKRAQLIPMFSRKEKKILASKGHFYNHWLYGKSTVGNIANNRSNQKAKGQSTHLNECNIRNDSNYYLFNRPEITQSENRIEYAAQFTESQQSPLIK